MLDLGTLRIGIQADSKSATAEVEKFGDTTKKAEETTDKSTKGMGDSWKGFSSTVKTYAAVGIAAVTGAVAGLVGKAQETQSSMGKLDTAFEQAGWSAEAAGDTYQGFVGLLGETDTAVEASNHLAQLCNSEEELSDWTNIAAGVFATFGDSLPLEGLTEAANETAKTGTVVGSLADALNWAGINEDEFNAKLAECNTEAERSQLITDTLNGLYSETGQKYRENNEDLIRYNESQDAMNQALSDLGEALMPVVTDITNFATELMNNAEPAVQWFKDNLPAIKDTFVEWAPAIAGVVGAFLGFQAASTVVGVIQGISTAITAWKTANEGLSIAQAALNAVMNANPFVLVATIIAGLVAALVTLWTTNEGFRNAVINAWNQIQATASVVWGAVVNFFTVTVPNAIQGLIDWFSQLPGNIANFLGSVISSVGSWVGQMASNAANAASQFGSSLLNGLASIPGQIVQVGSNIIQGLVNGITGGAQSVINAIGGVVDDAIGWAKGLLGIASPSKVFKEIGDFTMQGFEEGINDSLGSVVRTASDAAREVTDAFSPEVSVRAQGSSMADEAGRGISRTLSYVTDMASSRRVPASGGGTTNNYYIGDTSVDTITEQRFASEFIALMQRYGRLAVT